MQKKQERKVATLQLCIQGHGDSVAHNPSAVLARSIEMEPMIMYQQGQPEQAVEEQVDSSGDERLAGTSNSISHAELQRQGISVSRSGRLLGSA